MSRINVARSSMPSFEEYCEEIKSIWDTAQLTNMGPIHENFKSQVREYLKARHAELFVNGHLALYCAIKALELSGEIITTPFTFASTTNAVVQAGCAPVYCDVKPDYTIDESKIEALVTDKTSAILAVHVYGNVCNVEAIQKLADRYGLKVIYDAAHAFGVEYKNMGISSFGDISMFSFHASKVFHTIEGGCLTYHDEKLTSKLARLKNFGVEGEGLDCFGTNAKMNEFQAAMGICNLRHINDEMKFRRSVFKRYGEHLAGVKGITLPTADKDVKQNYAYYPILIEPELFGMDRDGLASKLAEHDIFARKYFYPLASENREFGADMSRGTPLAVKYSRNILCLPMYAHLDLCEVDRICDIVLS